MANDGAFGWIRRMGVHEAYHRAPANRAMHWLCIPIELWGVIKLLALVPIHEPVDLALIVILLVAPIYTATEPLVGTAMVAALMGLWLTAQSSLTGSALGDGAIGVGAFAVPFVVQTRVGHKLLEPEGRDDTEKNLAELRRTKNPIPILLVFYYHLVEVVFAAGYRPALRRRVEAFTEAEQATFVGSG